jgi:hypothetical protein
MHGRDWPFPKKMFAKTATLPPCYCPWQFIDSPGVQTLRENRGNWQIIGPSLPETTNQPDALDNPTPAMYPKTLQSITSVEWPGSSGVSGVSTPGWGPFEPRFGNRCARVIFGIFIKALPENPLQLSRGLARTLLTELALVVSRQPHSHPIGENALQQKTEYVGSLHKNHTTRVVGVSP